MCIGGTAVIDRARAWRSHTVITGTECLPKAGGEPGPQDSPLLPTTRLSSGLLQPGDPLRQSTKGRPTTELQRDIN